MIDQWEATCAHMRDAQRAAEQYGIRYSTALAPCMMSIHARTSVHDMTSCPDSSWSCRVMRMDFMEVVTNPCNATAKILEAWLNDVPHSVIEGMKCVPTVNHMYPHASGLASRIGEENALEIERQLKGTAYEWMLDLHATQWPRDGKDSVCFEW
eukprot:scaffold3083_cov440-Prasinococcus_capsulatus_cf.AAC.6